MKRFTGQGQRTQTFIHGSMQKKRCNPPILLKSIVYNQNYANMLHEFHRNLFNGLWYTRKMNF